MGVKIVCTIEADSQKEFKDIVMQLAGDHLSFGVAHKQNGTVALETHSPPPQHVAEAFVQRSPEVHESQPEEKPLVEAQLELPVEEQKDKTPSKRGRPPKLMNAAQIPKDADSQPITISMDQLIAALNEVFEKFNIDTARTILTRHGVSKVKDLRAPQYQSFLDACAEQMKLKPESVR